jgi:beta-glucosidase
LKEIEYHFGFGLSYTSFQFDSLQVRNISENDTSISIKVKVENTGDRAGSEVVQAYIGFKNSNVDRPIKLLRGFEKITLAAKESKFIEFEIPLSDLAWYNPEAMKWEIEAMVYEVYVGNSSNSAELQNTKFELNSDKTKI